jgi:hypothetical protein
VVDLLSKNFVPVAIDLRIDERPGPKPARGSAAAARADAERQLRREWGGLDQHRPIGLHVVLPEGKVIAGYNCRYVASGEKDVSDLLRFLREALGKAGKVSGRSVKVPPLNPERGAGLRPDGSIRLAVAVRSLNNGQPVNHRPVLESAYLTAAQLKSLAPPRAEVGVRYAIPEETARQFTTALTDDGDQVFTIRSQDATTAHFQAQVTGVSSSRIEVRLTGTLAGKRSTSERVVEGRARVQGLLTFNRKGALQSVLIVTDGQYRSPWAKQSHTVGGLVEWQAKP